MSDYTFRIEIENKRSVELFVRVTGADNEESAKAAADRYAEDVDIEDCMYDEDTDVTVSRFNDYGKTVDETISVKGEPVKVMQPIPPAEALFEFEGSSWATNGHFAIRVDAYPDGVACVEESGWRAAQPSFSKRLSAYSKAKSYNPADRADMGFNVDYIRSIVRKGDTFETNSTQVLAVFRSGDLVALVMPCYEGTKLADCLESMA